MLTLSKSGAGPVTAGDIQLGHDVELLNPELVLCNLTKPIDFKQFKEAIQSLQLFWLQIARLPQGKDA